MEDVQQIDDLILHRSGIFCRPFLKKGEGDDYIIAERRSYLRLEPNSDDVFLDIGANIGAVTSLFAPHVRNVVAVEPEPDNFRVLSRNAELFNNVELIRAAVTRAGDPIDLYVNETGSNKGTHRTHPVRGRRSIQVPGIAFDSLLSQVGPSLLKIDIEGGEYDFMDRLESLPASIRGIAIEMHRTVNEWKPLPRKIDAYLLSQGFSHSLAPRLDTQSWAVLGIYHR